jgi:hypothetical protein
MDITNFDSEDINVFLARVKIDALRENKDVKRVLIRAFLGGNNGEQSTPLKRAYINVYKIYKRQGVELVLQTFTNDLVRNKYHWSCTQLFDYLVSADIHLLPTHLHQGMLALGGSDTWNTLNILRNMERLRYHLGTPNGTYIDDSVGNQSKKYYIALEKEGLCAPTLFVDIFCDEVSANDVGNIER